jgi:hypothetical protein
MVIGNTPRSPNNTSLYQVTKQIEAHLAAFGQKCDIGKSHFEAALLLRDHEQLEAGALRTYATAR